MSIAQSLESLKNRISLTAPVLEQARMVDAIIGAYETEASEFTQLKKEHSVLKSEYEKFKSSTAEEIAALKSENAQLKPNPGDRMEDVCERALVRLANTPHQTTKDGFCEVFLSGIKKGKSEYYFDLLHDRGFVRYIDSIDSTIGVTKDGRKYLAKFGLI